MLKRNFLVAAATLVVSSSPAFAGSTPQHHQRSHRSLYEHRMSYVVYPDVGLRTGGAAIYDNTDLTYGAGCVSGHGALVGTL
jgi:hypothetical protein